MTVFLETFIFRRLDLDHSPKGAKVSFARKIAYSQVSAGKNMLGSSAYIICIAFLLIFPK